MTAIEMISVYTLGACGYGALEVLWRGRTHWSMLLAGGLCFSLIYSIACRSRCGPVKKLIMCAGCVTAVEFVAGCIVNLRLGWGVWDYSKLPLNLLGQICPLFTLYWFLLSIPAGAFSRLLRRELFQRGKS